MFKLIVIAFIIWIVYRTYKEEINKFFRKLKRGLKEGMQAFLEVLENIVDRWD